jgi:hypothetical protein
MTTKLAFQKILKGFLYTDGGERRSQTQKVRKEYIS